MSNVNEEIYTVDNLASSSTIVFVVRAQNHHGLSPPSPMSKVSETNELQIVGYFFSKSCRYHTSENNFHGNYSFLNLEIQIVAANFNFLPNKLNFCFRNYSRKETI